MCSSPLGRDGRARLAGPDAGGWAVRGQGRLQGDWAWHARVPPRPSSLKSFERCEIKEKSWISLRKTGGRAEGIVFPWEIGGLELILQWAALPRHSPVISFYGSYYFEFFQPLKNRNTIHSSEAAQKQGIGCLWPSGRWLTSAVKRIKRWLKNKLFSITVVYYEFPMWGGNWTLRKCSPWKV